MTDKQIIGGRGSAKSFTTLNTVEVLLENKKLKEALKAKEQECEELKDKLNKIEEHLETISYLAPVTTRVLKHSIKTIIEE